MDIYLTISRIYERKGIDNLGKQKKKNKYRNITFLTWSSVTKTLILNLIHILNLNSIWIDKCFLFLTPESNSELYMEGQTWENGHKSKGLRKELVHWSLWGNIIKNRNFLETRKPLHKGNRERKHFYYQINNKLESGEIEKQRGEVFEKRTLKSSFFSALGLGSMEPSYDPFKKHSFSKLVNEMSQSFNEFILQWVGFWQCCL